MESMIIENCPICCEIAKCQEDIANNFFVSSTCQHSICGPLCDNELDAIRYWNAMMRGLKSELTK